MAKKKKSKLSLSMLKYNALKLRSSYQLPFELVHQISLLTNDSDIAWIKYLSNMCEHLLRVKGYYKKYPDAEVKADSLIKDAVRDYGQ